MAHNLVIHVKYISDLSVWMKDATPHLNNVLLADYDWIFSSMKSLGFFSRKQITQSMNF